MRVGAKKKTKHKTKGTKTKKQQKTYNKKKQHEH